MKILSLTLLLMATLAFVLVGCTENSSPNVPSTTTNSSTPPSLMKSTSSGGAWIERYESNWLVWWFLDETGRLVSIGVHNLNYYCTAGQAWRGKDTLSYKLIELPNADPDLHRILAKIGDKDVTVMVFQVVIDPLKTNLRQYICGLQPIMTGTAKFLYHDNAWNGVGNNANAGGATVTGNLLGTDGQAYRLNVVYHYTWDLVDFATFKEFLKIQLNSTGQ